VGYSERLHERLAKELESSEKGSKKNEQSYSGLILRDTVNQRVSDPFGGEEKQGQDRESDLTTLGIEFFLRYGLAGAIGRRVCCVGSALSKLQTG